MASTGTSPPPPLATHPLARSPIAQHEPVRSEHDWEVSATRAKGGLRLADLTPLAKILVRGPDGSRTGRLLDCRLGTARRGPLGGLVVGAGPGEWLILAACGRAAEVLAELERTLSPERGGARNETELSTAIDVTHGSVVLRLTGAGAKSTLEKICAIDLSDRVTPDQACFRSSVARLRCLVVRDDLDGERSYIIESDRSSGQYLFDTILDAGAELAIEVDGYPDKEI